MQQEAFGLALHPAIDVPALARAYARDGHVQIAPFLSDESAVRLRDHLARRDDWRMVLNAGDKVYEIDRPGQADLSAAQRAQLDTMVAQSARSGFQYRYEAIRVSQEGESPEPSDPLGEMPRFMASPAALDLLRRVTGCAAIDFADAQATSYGPGDFLTGHDDDVAGKQRHAAYVLGLSDGWRAEWGGLLLLHDDAGDVRHGYTPRMNALNLFAVPQPHSVSQVTPFAAGPRLAITGWLRSRAGGEA